MYFHMFQAKRNVHVGRFMLLGLERKLAKMRDTIDILTIIEAIAWRDWFHERFFKAENLAATVEADLQSWSSWAEVPSLTPNTGNEDSIDAASPIRF